MFPIYGIDGINIFTKLKEINLLVVSNDSKLYDSFKKRVSLFKNLSKANEESFLDIYLNSNTAIDIVVMDLGGFKYVDFFAVEAIQPNQQFLFLAQNRKDYVALLRDFSCGSSSVLFKPVKFSAILDNIELLAQKNSGSKMVQLNNNIRVDISKEQVFHGERQIFLTGKDA